MRRSEECGVVGGVAVAGWVGVHDVADVVERVCDDSRRPGTGDGDHQLVAEAILSDANLFRKRLAVQRQQSRSINELLSEFREDRLRAGCVA